MLLSSQVLHWTEDAEMCVSRHVMSDNITHSFDEEDIMRVLVTQHGLLNYNVVCDQYICDQF